jgi:hypothetical protein
VLTLALVRLAARLEDEIPISYQWLPVTAATTTVPQRQLPLTTWYGSGSAYKTLSIDPPTGVKSGETWLLALFCSPSNVGGASSAASLGAVPPHKTSLVALSSVEDAGAWVPVPVMSEPIRFTAAAKGGSANAPASRGGKVKTKAGPSDKVEKQDRIQRAFVLPTPPAEGDGPHEILLTEQTSFDLDKVRPICCAFGPLVMEG